MYENKLFYKTNKFNSKIYLFAIIKKKINKGILIINLSKKLYIQKYKNYKIFIKTLLSSLYDLHNTRIRVNVPNSEHSAILSSSQVSLLMVTDTPSGGYFTLHSSISPFRVGYTFFYSFSLQRSPPSPPSGDFSLSLLVNSDFPKVFRI